MIVSVMAMSLAASAQADQPHMKAALEHLKSARAELQVAEHNKGGWRVRALKNVNAAISETENGMSVGGSH